ncbi:hypothetical protein E4U22_006978, partial [Claviceps purpurea]
MVAVTDSPFNAHHSRRVTSRFTSSIPITGQWWVVSNHGHMSSILAREKYLVKLCRALIMYGAPKHRLEEYMSMSSRALEIE